MKTLTSFVLGLLLAVPVQGQVELDVDPTLALGWKLQFSDNFNRPQIGEDWQVISGDWSIRDGMLRGERPVIVCAWTFTGSVRLEFDTIANDPKFSDLSAILYTKPDTGATGDGYFFGFGSDGNKASKLLVKDTEAKRYDVRVELGKRYRIVCQREGNQLTHMIDGKVVATVKVNEPLPTDRRTVALYTYSGGMFDNVRIYTKGGSANRPPPKDTRVIEADVTLLDADKQPAQTSGPGQHRTSHAAFDFNHRSLCLDLGREDIVTRIVLKSDPHAHPHTVHTTSNRNLDADTVELHVSDDNRSYVKLPCMIDKPDKDTVVLHGFRSTSRYVKVHYAPKADAKYAFTNLVNAMVWVFGPPTASLPTSYDIDNPLFEELFGNQPAPDRFLVYGSDRFDAREGNAVFVCAIRATAKRFGARFIHKEQLDLAGERGYVPYGKLSYPGNRSRGIDTWSRCVEPPRGNTLISLPDDSLPLVYGTYGWLLDPRYLDYLVTEWAQRAKDREQWGIPQFDEIWTYYTIKPVPRDKWYKQVEEADREVREKYGFGRYGIPLTHRDGGPFERIAHRRWASDRLTEVFGRIHKAVKAINPDMKIIGPTHGSSATSADMEAWGPYFDIMGGQCAGGASDNLIDLMRPGGVTKLYVDLTERPIWMMVHMSKDHAKRRDPEYIREAYSQVFRNGGQNVWLMTTEFFERELVVSIFCEPSKWRSMAEVAEMIRHMRLPRLPKADCAILYSSNTTYTTMWGGLTDHKDRIIGAYTVAGPALRSWPRYVSDRQIERGERDLSKYKVLYVPYNVYATPELLDKVKDYARNGGIVICTDTEAFTWNINGEKFGDAWTQFAGVRITGPREDAAGMRLMSDNPFLPGKSLNLTALVPGSHIEPVSDKVVNLATFADGSPAVTLHPYGKGKVIFFAADPFISMGVDRSKKSTIAKDSPIVQFAEAIHRHAGVEMGHDIWRFKLPPYKGDVYQKRPGECLTNNYVYDANKPLLEPNNIDVGGTYSYSRAPNAVADKGGAGEAIPFATGHLTNRLKAFETRNLRGYRNRSKEALDAVTANWVAQWQGTEPIHITFDLKSKRSVSRVRLFYSGDAKVIRVVDENGAKLDETRFDAPVGEDVMDVMLSTKGNHQRLRLEIEPGETFQLSEVEIWGQ